MSALGRRGGFSLDIPFNRTMLHPNGKPLDGVFGMHTQEYLTDVLARLPSTKITQIHDLLPAHWKPPSADTS